jgi:hypothetical protein
MYLQHGLNASASAGLDKYLLLPLFCHPGYGPVKSSSFVQRANTDESVHVVSVYT